MEQAVTSATSPLNGTIPSPNPTVNKNSKHKSSLVKEEPNVEKMVASLVTFFSGASTVDVKIKEHLGDYVKQIATVEKDDKISKAYALNESGDVIGLGQSIDVRDFLKHILHTMICKQETVAVKANEISVLQFPKNYAPDVVILEATGT